MIRATWRTDIKSQRKYPACSEEIDIELWYWSFEVLHCEDFETLDGFNMLLKHPIKNRVLMVCSVDFDFSEDCE
jgi:hypothetical protein